MKLSIYIIKGYVNQEQIRKNNLYSLKSQKISNFKMAKRATLQLEYRPKQIEFCGDFFLIIYKKSKNNNQF